MTTNLQDAIDIIPNIISNFSLSKFKDSEDVKLIKEFYESLLERLKKESQIKDKKSGNKLGIPNILQSELSKIIEKINTNKKISFVKKEENIVKDSLKDFFPRKWKWIDLYIDGGLENRIAIEIKSTLGLWPLGDAYLESIITHNHDKFFVVSLFAPKNEYEKLIGIIKNTELKNKISDIVVFLFYKQQSGFEESVINFFVAIRNASNNQ